MGRGRDGGAAHSQGTVINFWGRSRIIWHISNLSAKWKLFHQETVLAGISGPFHCYSKSSTFLILTIIITPLRGMLCRRIFVWVAGNFLYLGFIPFYLKVSPPTSSSDRLRGSRLGRDVADIGDEKASGSGAASSLGPCVIVRTGDNGWITKCSNDMIYEILSRRETSSCYLWLELWRSNEGETLY